MFWEQFWPELITTVIGVFLSIPATLCATFLGAGLGVLGAWWLSNYIERRTETERKSKILKLLEEEISINITILSNYNIDDYILLY